MNRDGGELVCYTLDIAMKNVLLLHDLGGYTGIQWEQWLHDELLKHGFIVTMPSLTNAEYPDRKVWLEELEQTMLTIDTEHLIIVGHSIGVALALDYIEQSLLPVEALVSVAGFTSDYGELRYSYFLRQKNVDFSKVKSKLKRAVVVYGDDDRYVPLLALQQLAADLGVPPIIIHGGGHLNTENGYTTFPKVLSIVEQLAV